MTCQARRQSDQMVCGRCGLQWDHDDPEPPACVGDQLSTLALSTRDGHVNTGREETPCAR